MRKVFTSLILIVYVVVGFAGIPKARTVDRNREVCIKYPRTGRPQPARSKSSWKVKKYVVPSVTFPRTDHHPSNAWCSFLPDQREAIFGNLFVGVNFQKNLDLVKDFRSPPRS
jgi:hypothetical protein